MLSKLLIKIARLLAPFIVAELKEELAVFAIDHKTKNLIKDIRNPKVSNHEILMALDTLHNR